MITLLFAATVVLALVWLIHKRSAGALAATFLLLSLMPRIVGLSYVDLAGPVYADELEDFIGGSGSSMPLFACSVLAFFLPLGYAFRPSRLKHLKSAVASLGRKVSPLADMVFVLIVVFLLALYADMLLRGPVPLFVGMDRIEYNRTIAGPLHPYIFEYGFLFAASIGCFFVHPRLKGGDFDSRFLGLLLAFLAYFALTGNRFSAFYAFMCFFVLPLATLPALKTAGVLPPPPRRRTPWKATLFSPAALVVAAALGAVLILMLLVNSVVNVRGYDDPAAQFLQRTLIQPVELWWTTWDGLNDHTDQAFGLAWDATLGNPIDPTRNTSIQMLMVKNLGDDRATELIADGAQYAGGYPEILFELVGPWFALPVALAFGCITAVLLRLVITSICIERFALAFVALYVYYAFSLLYIGGMLNFLIAWTFWVKCGALLLLWFMARHHVAAASRASGALHRSTIILPPLDGRNHR